MLRCKLQCLHRLHYPHYDRYEFLRRFRVIFLQLQNLCGRFRLRIYRGLKEYVQDYFQRGIKSEEISYKIHRRFEFLGQMSVIRYVDNPSETVKEEAQWFLESNRDLVRCIIQEHDTLIHHLKQLEESA